VGEGRIHHGHCHPVAPPMEALLKDRRLVYVTGKGGVGKTTCAAAVGLAAAEAGRRTIVCEVAEQDRVSRAFRREGVTAETEVQLADNLWAITIDPNKALQEWLAKQLGGGAPLRLMTRSHAFQYFVAAAPGAKELITIAKVWELAQLSRWDARNRTYDLVVVDAPASGHGLAMLTTPHTFGEIARVGPIRRQAGKIEALLSDPAQTGYVAVALPEEMPVNETVELEGRLGDELGVKIDQVVVNAMLPERFSDNAGTTHDDDGDLHPGETVEEKISLSERFGLWLSFYPFKQDDYLGIVAHWLASFGCTAEQIANARGDALRWALQRGSRSGRVAWQFARDYAGKH